MRAADTYRPARRNAFRQRGVIAQWRLGTWARDANVLAKIAERIKYATAEARAMAQAAASAGRHGLTVSVAVKAALVQHVRNAIMLRTPGLTNAYRKRISKELGLA